MKKVRLYILALIFSAVLISCNSSRQNIASSGSNQRMEQSSSDFLLSDKSKFNYNGETVEKKILFSAFLSLTVHLPDTANSHIERITKKYDGYINEIGTYRTTIRVKSENLEDAIKDISTLGKVQSKNISGQDVTEDYLDYQIRLENAEKSRQRYLELLEKAENVEAALKVERELERLNETIDLLKGKMNRINHLSEFSTITIILKEKKKPGLLGYIGIGLYRSVKWLFVRN